MKSMELFFELMDYEFLMLVAKKKNIRINGFINIKKAPKNLIRNIIKVRFSNKKEFQELLFDIFNNRSSEYKGKSLEDFISEFYLSPSKSKYNMFETYGILMNLFPDDAEKLCNKISINIESGKHIFSGLLVNERDITEENCISIIEKYLHVNDEISFLENNIEIVEGNLLKLEKIDEYKRIKQSIKNKSMVDICREFGDLSEIFDESLLWLAFISLNIGYIKRDKNTISFFNKLLFNILQFINKDLLSFEKDNIKRLKEECLNRVSEIFSLNKSINYLNQEVSDLSEVLRKYKKDIERLEEIVVHNVSFNLNENEPDIIIITNYIPDRVMDSIGSYKIIAPIKVTEYSRALKDFKGIVYIDRSAIDSTRNLLILEDYLDALKCRRITIFSKNVEELAQNVIVSKFRLGV